MTVRITDTFAQVAAVIVATVLTIFAGVSVTLVVGVAAGSVVMNALILGTVVAAARTFRGAEEGVAPPRPWWRLTAHAATGYIWAAVFLTQSVYLAILTVRADQPAGYVAAAVLDSAVTALFLNSSIRLGRTAGTPVAGV